MCGGGGVIELGLVCGLVVGATCCMGGLKFCEGGGPASRLVFSPNRRSYVGGGLRAVRALRKRKLNRGFPPEEARPVDEKKGKDEEAAASAVVAATTAAAAAAAVPLELAAVGKEEVPADAAVETEATVSTPTVAVA